MTTDYDTCPRCWHQRRHHWPDDQRSQPGCHAQDSRCLCSWDPDEVDRARAARAVKGER